MNLNDDVAREVIRERTARRRALPPTHRSRTAAALHRIANRLEGR